MEIIESNKIHTKVFHDGEVYLRYEFPLWYILIQDDSRTIYQPIIPDIYEDLYQIELLRIIREKKLNRIV